MVVMNHKLKFCIGMYLSYTFARRRCLCRYLFPLLVRLLSQQQLQLPPRRFRVLVVLFFSAASCSSFAYFFCGWEILVSPFSFIFCCCWWYCPRLLFPYLLKNSKNRTFGISFSFYSFSCTVWTIMKPSNAVPFGFIRNKWSKIEEQIQDTWATARKTTTIARWRRCIFSPNFERS